MATPPDLPHRSPHGATATRPSADTPIALVDPPIVVTSVVQESPTLSDEDTAALDTDKRILDIAKRRYRTVVQAEGRLRRDMLRDRQMRLCRLGDTRYQWPEKLLKERLGDNRPVLQINRLAGAVAIAKNAGDNANLRIQVNPVDDKGDVKVAQVIAGLIRNIETRSFAEDDAYSTAADGQCEMGRGYMWIVTEWESDDSFRQRATIERILNPFRVKVDPSAQKKDESDAEYAFYDTDIDADTWRSLYGTDPKTGETREVPTANDCDWTGDIGDQSGEWFPSDERISLKHYFAAEYEDDTLYELSTPLPDGRSTVHEKDIDAEVRRLAEVARHEYPDSVIDQTAITAGMARFKKTYVKRRRPLKRRIMKWRVIDALYVHEETTWPTPWQPFIPMVGDESDLDGDHDRRGVVRDGIDSQMVYNIEVSAQAEAVNDMPKAPWVGVKGVFGAPNTPMNEAWRTANRKRHAYLEYEPVEVDGKIASPPQRTFAEPAIGGINAAIQQADNDIKATTRVHDASLAERGPQESGRAITARQRQDEMANSHFTRNRRRALASAARQLVYLIRTIYDVATVIRITGADDQKQAVMVFAGSENDPRYVIKDGVRVKDEAFQLPEGVEGIYDIGAGDYDIEVTAGPEPGSRRQEDLQTMAEFVRVLPPQYMVNFMDLLFKLVDSPVGRQLSERADKLLRPDLRDQTGDDGTQVDIPPEIIEGMRQYIALAKMFVEEGNVDRRTMLQGEIDRITQFMDAATRRVSDAEDAVPEPAPASAGVSPGQDPAAATAAEAQV